MTALREFRLPDLGEGLTESDIVSWHVHAGDRVELNQVIAEVETAKALVDLPSPYAGVVASLHAEEGQTVSVGEPLVTFEVDDGAATPNGAAPASGAAPAVPDETPAPPAPRAAEPASDDGPEPNLVGYGARPDRVGRPARRPRRAAGETQVPRRVTSTAVLDHDTHGPGGAGATSGAPTRTTGERPRSTPPVRALAKKLGVRIDRVEGTGREGLITREDVLAAVSCHRDVVRPARGAAPAATTTAPPAAAALAAPAPAVPSGAPAVPPGGAQTPAPGDAGLLGAPDAEVVPVRGVRKHTAAAMVTSAFTAPHATVFLTVDVTRSVELLDRLRTHRLARGARITVLALAARALCLALPRHPELNSAWRDLPDGSAEIVRHRRVNLGIAVATDRGLVVPNVPDAQDLDLPGLAAALTDLTTTAREGRTTPERLTGGTISITNVGVFGVDAGTPILVPGEAAILGLGAVRRRPWEHDGEVALRDVVTLSLSFDHRVVDGEQGARFLADLGALLEDPALALVGAAPGTGRGNEVTG
ncbi:dihydrolipoamide acetyltransferase family protein [Cellulosimicrobium composti]|uniref:Dihydrolipoamide acetyltransferase component of pyruvate dehydrogenase complex n=1 Tax=Cellulosimicrobium composti TaxID=2672572 RepID=A0ABX0BCK0_9MICO|nr:dihydrolipoamide acetyltransferase family protein [Cellulosimicrobium composti]NDO90342.1 2-oxo acid dehydrogenase subunit E2 [Cellulosimicrobium composti]